MITAFSARRFFNQNFTFFALAFFCHTRSRILLSGTFVLRTLATVEDAPVGRMVPLLIASLGVVEMVLTEALSGCCGDSSRCR